MLAFFSNFLGTHNSNQCVNILLCQPESVSEPLVIMKIVSKWEFMFHLLTIVLLQTKLNLESAHVLTINNRTRDWNRNNESLRIKATHHPFHYFLARFLVTCADELLLPLSGALRIRHWWIANRKCVCNRIGDSLKVGHMTKHFIDGAVEWRTAGFN